MWAWFVLGNIVFFIIADLMINVLSYIEIQVVFILALLITTAVFSTTIKRKQPFNISDVVVNVLAGEGKGLEFLIVFFIGIVASSWSADYLESPSVENILKSLSAIVYLVSTVIFYTWYIQITESKKVKTIGNPYPKPTKVLIFAFSTIPKQYSESLLMSAEENDVNGILELLKQNRKINLNPPLQILDLFKDKLEQTVILVSKESEKHKKVIELLAKHTTKSEINFSEPVDFNEYYDILDQIEYQIKKLHRKHYKDEDISIFISSGTSIVTAALVMAAVREGRQVIYYTQREEGSTFKAFNISIDDVKRFVKEISLGS